MLSERVYRRLLVVYPREHREEYGELMVQLFRDRMHRDGGGLIVWVQMTFDLVGSAFKEHKEEKEGDKMKKRIGIGVVLVAVVLMGVVGAGTLLAQSQGKTVVSVSVQEGPADFNTFTGDGVDEIAEKLQEAVEEGAITQEMVDEIAQLLDGDVPSDAWLHSFEADGLAEALQQAVEEGVITQGGADQALLSSNGRSSGGRILISSPQVKTFTVGVDGVTVGADVVAGALRQAVNEGLISQTLADEILQSLDGGNTES